MGPWAAGSGRHLGLISPLSHIHCLGLFTSTNQVGFTALTLPRPPDACLLVE